MAKESRKNRELIDVRDYEVQKNPITKDTVMYVSNDMNSALFIPTRKRADKIWEMVEKAFSLEQFRLCQLYCAKINVSNVATRLVVIPVSEYCSFFGIDPEYKNFIDRLDADLEDLETRYFRLNTSFGKEDYILFDYTAVTPPDDNGQRYIYIKCSEVAIPLFFWKDPRVNLRLKQLEDGRIDKSSLPSYTKLIGLGLQNATNMYQVRFYAFLAQYAYKGEVKISLMSFVERIYGTDYMEEDEYGDLKSQIDWNSLRRRIAKLLKYVEKVGIKASCKPCSRSGKGGTIKAIKFTIEHTDITAPDPAEISELVNDECTCSPESLITAKARYQSRKMEKLSQIAISKGIEAYTEEEWLDLTGGRLSKPDELYLNYLCLRLLAGDSLFNEWGIASLTEICRLGLKVPAEKLPEEYYIEDHVERHHYRAFSLLRELKSKIDAEYEQGTIKDKYRYYRSALKQLAECP